MNNALKYLYSLPGWDDGAVAQAVVCAKGIEEHRQGKVCGRWLHETGHHITLLFDENSGRNWILYGSDNTPDFAAHTLSLSGLFASAYRNRKPTVR